MKILRRLYGERGFTLIELLIVVAILGVIAVVVIPNVVAFQASQQEIEAVSPPVSDIWLLSGEYFQTTWSVEYLPNGIFFGLADDVSVYVPYSNLNRVVTSNHSEIADTELLGGGEE